MDWLWAAVAAWFGWNIVAPFLAFVATVILLLLFSIPGAIRQSRCAHENGVRETRSCDAICRECGKNLGFIGTWREQQTIPKTATR